MKKSDVEHPMHYRKRINKPETWDWIREGVSDEEFIGFLKGNVYKYLHRYDKKGGITDLEKAREYIKKLIEVEEEIE
jgi:hypothetical protein